MANYPNIIDTFANPSGTQTIDSPDHALDHRNLGSAVIGVENVLGTTAGTSVFKSYQAGWFPLAIVFGAGNNGTPQTNLVNGTFNNGIFGTSTLQAPTINGLGTNSGTIVNGIYNNPTLGTPIIGSISVPGTVNALGFSAAITPGVGTITDVAGGTLTVNAQQGQIFYSAMGTAAGNRTIGTPLNPSAYQQLTYAFKASGSANGTLVWSSIFRFSQDTGTPVLGTSTSWNYYGWRYNFIDSKWDFMGQSKNII